MSTISKVKSVQGDGDWTNNYGTFYKFEYTFEDGTTLSASHKTADGNYKVGEEVEYEVKGQNDHGKYGKVSKPQQQSFNGGVFKGGKQSGSTASFALSYAKDVAVAHIGQGKQFGAKEIIQVADEFNKWLKENA